MSFLEQTVENNCEGSKSHETYDVHGFRISMWHSVEYQERPYHVNDTAPILVVGYRDSSMWDLGKIQIWHKHINKLYIRVLASIG